MKRSAVILLLTIFCTIYLSAQSETSEAPLLTIENSEQVDSTEVAEAQDTTSTERILGIHPWKAPEYVDKKGSWSISIEGGLNLFDGDISQPFHTIIPTSNFRPTLGVGVEYSINPVWGIAANYYYAPYHVSAANGTENSELSGLMQSAELSLTIDLIDLWFPKRKKCIFSLYLIAGGGIGWYDCKLSNPNGITVEGRTATTSGRLFGTEAYASTEGEGTDLTGVIPLGIAAEFNISRMFAIGMKGMYRLHTSDNLDSWAYSEPNKGGTTNDFMEYLTVNFRWKFPARHADHKRNWREPVETILPPKRDTVVIAYEPRIDTVYVMPPSVEAGAAAVVVANNQDEIPYIYFDNDKYVLLDESLIIIHKIANKMLADTTLYVETRGFCDNTASLEYNQTLSENRANITKNELVTVYNIAPERIIANGRGKLTNPPSSYRPNRRVEFHFMSAKEAAELRETLKQTTPAVVSNEESTPAATTSSVVDLSAPRTYTEFIATETLRRGQTLSTYAKKYYGSGDFWVYIYEANKSTISHPDRVQEGAKIKIPKLPAALVDKSNATCIENANLLASKYLK